MRPAKFLLALCFAVPISVTASGQNFSPPYQPEQRTSIGATFDTRKIPAAPVTRAECKNLGGIVLGNAVCFPELACATVDRNAVERMACLAR